MELHACHTQKSSHSDISTRTKSHIGPESVISTLGISHELASWPVDLRRPSESAVRRTAYAVRARMTPAAHWPAVARDWNTAACASPPWPAGSAAPASSAACSTTSTRTPARRRTPTGHRHRQHRRRHHALRPAGLPRHRHRCSTPSAAASTRARAGGAPTRRTTVAEELAALRRRAAVVRARRQGLRHPRLPLAVLGQGMPLSEVIARLVRPLGPAATAASRLLPMTDTPVETHVVVETRTASSARSTSRSGGCGTGPRCPPTGSSSPASTGPPPAPGVLDAIREADVVLLPPSNPVVSIGIILGVPGVRDALRGTRAPVVGVSPLVGGRPVRGHADACLRAIGVEETSAGGRRALRGLPRRLARRRGRRHADAPGRLAVVGPAAADDDVEAAADIAGAALDLGLRLRAERRMPARPGAGHRHPAARHARGAAPATTWPTLRRRRARRARGGAAPTATSLVVSSKVATKALGLVTHDPRPGPRSSPARRVRVVAERRAGDRVTRVVEARSPGRSWPRRVSTRSNTGERGGVAAPAARTPTRSARAPRDAPAAARASRSGSCSATPRAGPGGWVRSTSRSARTGCGPRRPARRRRRRRPAARGDDARGRRRDRGRGRPRQGQGAACRRRSSAAWRRPRDGPARAPPGARPRAHRPRRLVRLRPGRGRPRGAGHRAGHGLAAEVGIPSAQPEPTPPESCGRGASRCWASAG